MPMPKHITTRRQAQQAGRTHGHENAHGYLQEAAEAAREATHVDPLTPDEIAECVREAARSEQTPDRWIDAAEQSGDWAKIPLRWRDVYAAAYRRTGAAYCRKAARS